VLPIESISWLFPGVVDALTPVAVYRLGASLPPKVAWGRKRRQSNRAAAYATIAPSMTIAVAVELYMPPLPQ